MGDVAFREDACNQKEFSEYFLTHRRSWLDFAESLGYDLSLSDLILVDGCDKTSEWACAAWSDKTSSLRLDFVAGAPGIAEGNACLWGQWDSSESLDENVGPQPLTPPVAGSDMILRSTPLPSNAMSIDDPGPLPPPIFNQCVFVRGFQMGDWATWFKRKKIRIDVGSGFKAVPKSLELKMKSNNSTTADRNLPPSEGSQSMLRGGPQTGIHPRANMEEVNSFICDSTIIAFTSLIYHQHDSPAEALIDYIFQVGFWPITKSILFNVLVLHRILLLSWP